MPREIGSVRGIAIQGKDYTASDSACGQVGIVEAWVWVGPDGQAGAVAEVGAVRIRSDRVPLGAWRRLAVCRSPAAVPIFLDGEQGVDQVEPAVCRHVRLGVHWGGRAWGECFHGALVQLRFHSGRLTVEQIQANYRQSGFLCAVAPDPADDSMVAASRRPAPGRLPETRAAAGFDLYFGTDHDLVAAAGRSSAACPITRHASTRSATRAPPARRPASCRP